MYTSLRKILVVLLCLTLIICLIPTAFAANERISKNVVIPKDATVIEEEAFLNCSSMVRVTIPVGVTRIGNRAFYGCSGLKDVYYGGTEEQWDAIVLGTGNGPLTRATIHCSASVPGDAIVLKIGVSTADTDPRNIAANDFADEIEEKTNGAVKAEVYPSGQLGGDGLLVEALALNDGTVDIVITDASNFGVLVPDMNISGLPFLFADFDAAFAFMEGEIEAAAEAELLDLTDVHVLTHYSNGFRCVTNSKGPVETPDDMKGMLIRTPENQVIMSTMSALGANPQPLAFSELYRALQQKTYDAQENPIPIIYNNKFYEVQEFLSVTNHIYSGLCFAISGSAWDSLTAEQQEIVAAAAQASGEWQREAIRQQTDDLVAKLEEKGMNINFPDLAPFAAATRSVIEENALGISEHLLTALAALSEEADP